MLALIVTLWETMLFIDSRLHVVVSGTASTLDENNGGRQRGKRSSHSSSPTRQNNMQGSLSGHNSPGAHFASPPCSSNREPGVTTMSP